MNLAHKVRESPPTEWVPWLHILSTLWHRCQATSPLPHPPLRPCQAQKTFPTKAPIHHFFTLCLKCDVVSGNTRAKYGIENSNCTRVVALWFSSPFLMDLTNWTPTLSCPDYNDSMGWEASAWQPALVSHFLMCSSSHVSERPKLLPVNVTFLHWQDTERGGRGWDMR